MSTSKNKSQKSVETSAKTNKVRPRALVRKQVENKDYHVSDEDMANLDTSVEPTEREVMDVTEKLGDKSAIKPGSSYDILE